MKLPSVGAFEASISQNAGKLKIKDVKITIEKYLSARLWRSRTENIKFLWYIGRFAAQYRSWVKAVIIKIEAVINTWERGYTML